MSLKALNPLLDPVLGQDVELGLCGDRMEVREMLLLGPFPLFPSLFSPISYHCEGASYVARNRVKE
jgi:hypothetical protein